MFCEKCGGEVRKEKKLFVCDECGAKYGLDYGECCDDIHSYKLEKVVVSRFSSKKNIIIIALAGVLALGIGGTVAIAIGGSNTVSQSSLSRIRLAERYLSELKYEQAVIEFQRVLKIEPRNVDAYLGLAKAYIGLGDTEKALETLRKGLEITGDQRIQAMIDELSKPKSVRILGREYDIATTTSIFFETPREEIDNQILKEIAQLTNLEELWISGDFENTGKITDISPLSEIHNLRYLNLDHHKISDITPLAELTNLEFLRIADNQISDITPLAGLTNLKWLWMEDNQISDISSLRELKHLSNLSLHRNSISNIDVLSGMVHMDTLDLAENQISDITALKNLTDLTDLNLSYNPISDITALSSLTDLIEIRLQYTQISDITPLAELKKLTHWYVWEGVPDGNAKNIWLQNQLDPYRDCGRIAILDSEYNIGYDTSVGLERHEIDDEQLKQIVPQLKQLNKLIKLDISYNQITDITPLTELENLRWLELDNNPISDIKPLAKLAKLSELVLYNTQISDEDKVWLKEQLPSCYIEFN